MNRAEERQLIQQAKAGDKGAFASLYQACVQPIFRYVLARVGDVAQAEDITSEVFMRAITGLASYQDEGHPFLAWLYRIAHARVVDAYRQHGRTPIMNDIEATVLPFEMNFDERLARKDAVQALQTALATLTEEQRTVITLRFVEGYSLEETALAMRKNANAIKALQHRAVRAIATRLERAGVDVAALLAGLS